MQRRGTAPIALLVALSFSSLGLVSCKKQPRELAPPLVWHDLAEGERLARGLQKPALIFVWADWSTADMAMWHETFPAPEVREALRDWVLIRINATDDENKDVETAKNRFRVVGLPTIIATDFSEVPRQELFRVNEFIKPDKLASAVRLASTERRTVR